MRKPRELHGATNTRLYSTWKAMRMRCRHTPRYRDRGIRVCAEWDQSFIAFKTWSEANGYADGLTIDRIDNYAGYAPGNCRWVTADMQHANKRPAAEWNLPQRKVTPEIARSIAARRQDGLTMQAIADEHGLSIGTVHRTLRRSA